jgi:hypothetical protein
VANASTIGQIEIPLVRSDNLIIAGCIAVGLIARERRFTDESVPICGS